MRIRIGKPFTDSSKLRLVAGRGIATTVFIGTVNRGCILKDNGFTVGKTEVIAVEVDDRPGGLARILGILNKEKINVEYMYAFVERSQNNAVIIFRFDDQFIDRAIKLLKDAGITVLEDEKVYSL